MDIRRRGVQGAHLLLWDDLAIACLLVCFPAPHSYTGDETIELLLPGNAALLEGIIDWLIARLRAHDKDARRAEAGEFTARAFLNGRMSLTEAEGVNAIISARSDAELRAGSLLTSGALGSLANALADDLASALALVEAGIDFTDQDDVVAIAPADLLARLGNLAKRLREHLDRAVPFEALEAIPWVVIAGPPNAGKSTLFNALLGRERVVVSPVPGTTRDVIAEPLRLDSTDGISKEVLLADIAGLDATNESFLNVEMQRAARRALDRAELVLRCTPADDLQQIDTEDEASREFNVVTKCDLAPHHTITVRADSIRVSARTGSGLESRRRAISERLSERAVSLAADSLALLPRHESALRSSRAHIEEAVQQLQARKNARTIHQPEIIASLIRLALDDLAALAGSITPDDILGRIFAGFCIGK